ncbi:MAG: hypothetical protein FWF73_00120 [Spirochaetes bacterium]|nr:hypothetical protein [Spirochaetota bacterium]
MAIENREYYYKILETDSLTRIADKHGLTPPIEWARKIWEDEKNKWMHTESDKYGKKAKRQIHIGNNKYAIYEPSKFGPGYRGYEDPHQIIFYEGEKIWIPKEDSTDRIIHDMSDDELINGFRPEFGKKYRLIFPAMKVIVNTSKEISSDSDKYTLSGYDDKGELIYKRSLVVKEDGVDNNGIKELEFQATPTCLRYNLEVTYNPDSKKKKKKTVELIAGTRYSRNFNKNSNIV